LGTLARRLDVPSMQCVRCPEDEVEETQVRNLCLVIVIYYTYIHLTAFDGVQWWISQVVDVGDEDGAATGTMATGATAAKATATEATGAAGVDTEAGAETGAGVAAGATKKAAEGAAGTARRLPLLAAAAAHVVATMT
jgi:hypothetical protein